MARQPRYAAPGQAQHIVQRGNNRGPIFRAPSDYLFFRACLLKATGRFECFVHAYVLMTNHVHLLMSPRHSSGIGKVMQSVGREYVPFFNDRYQRTGALWEGRYRATVIDTDEYLFTCCRYIEENPVRAGMVDHPSRYPWSSYGANALGIDDPLVTPHERYLALDASPMVRQSAYREVFALPSEGSSHSVIRNATNYAWALGGETFRQSLSRLGRRAGPATRGRPPIK